MNGQHIETMQRKQFCTNNGFGKAAASGASNDHLEEK